MVKKDKKAKAAEKKARVTQKQDKKTAQKEKKAKPKRGPGGGGDVDSDAEDVDMDAVLAAYAAQQEQFLKVTETPASPPSARASASILASPANDNELLLFGGEYFDGARARFYNDLLVYNVLRDEWRQVTSPNTPLPRSGHAWCRGGNDSRGVYLFGGEFSSPKQGTFYHYNDFWRLDPATREWAKLSESKAGKGPPARSGHRMTYYKSYVVLYGGFQDTSQQTRYLADLWLYDCANFVWHCPALPPASQKPDARSSFTFLPHDSGAVLYGGYSRVKSSMPVRQTKGGGGGGLATQMALKPMVHQDTWFLRITPPPPEAPSTAPPTVRWERRKRPVNAPAPTRAGATMAYHKGRGIQFGGVHDVEESDEGIDSDFFNTLYVWNVDRNRYFSLALRRPRAQPQKQLVGSERGKRGRGRADEEELLRNLAALEANGRVDDQDTVSSMPVVEKDDEDSAADARPQKLVAWEMPHPRFNAQLAVQDDVLYIFGGTYEKGDREYTFDEMWAVDLGKLDGVKEIFRRELEDWHGSDDDEEDSEEEDEDGEDDDDDEDDHDLSENSTAITNKRVVGDAALGTPPVQTAETAEPPAEDDSAGTATVLDSALADNLPHPRPFEALRSFYARTSIAWQEALLEEMKYQHRDAGGERSVKEIRKGAFERAEEKWWDCREEIRALEDEQEAAGIGEVVSIADKAAANVVGVGKRR